jgi:hypothetical protein
MNVFRIPSGSGMGIIVKGFCCLPSTWGGASEDQADRGRFPAGSSEAWWIHRMSVWSLWVGAGSTSMVDVGGFKHFYVP